MTTLVECVPNFSEGRRPEVIAAIVAAVASVKGVAVLDHTSDASHNRSVVTFAGVVGPVATAAAASLGAAVELIDMERHSGAHPRIGAVDVMPFVPLDDTPMSEVVALARTFAERSAATHDLPVYVYGEAALRPDRRRLADVRRGEYEGLRDLIRTDPLRAPDFGPRRLHPSAGAMAVGARTPLIAFNVNLSSNDIRVAERIARSIRESSGGMPAVQAMAVLLDMPDGGHVAQVSTNLVDWRRTGITAVVREIRRLARESGTDVANCELIGLAPAGALSDAADEGLDFPDKALEVQVARMGIR